MRADSFKKSIKKILSFPLWVKQVIYMSLKQDLSRIFVNQAESVNVKDFLQIYMPKITFVGKRELEQRLHNHEEIMYTFLKEVSEGKAIIDITLDCFLTLQETSKLYLEAVKNEYISPSGSKIIHSTAEFFAGEIKTGEYLMRTGRLTVDQLDIAIRQQAKLAQEGNKVHMAEVIAGLGFISKDEIVSVLIMKEECKKRFIFNMDFNSVEIADKETIRLQKKIEQLEYENNYLKTKLNTLLKMGQ